MNHPNKMSFSRRGSLFVILIVSIISVSNVSAAVTKLTIQAIEVTQAIQCLDQSTGYTNCADNSLELTTNRPVAIRVYFKHDGSSKSDPFDPILLNVPVTIRWIATHEDYPIGLPDEKKISFHVPGETDLNKLRSDTRGSANFIIPPYVNMDPNDPSDKRWLLGNPNKKNLLWVQAEVEFQGSIQTMEIQLGGKDAQGTDLPGGLFPRGKIRVGWMYVYYNPKPGIVPPPSKNFPSPEVGAFDWFMYKIFPRPFDYISFVPTFVSYDYKNCPSVGNGCPSTAADVYPLLHVLQQVYGIVGKGTNIDALIGWLPNTQGQPGAALGDVAWVLQKSPATSQAALAHEVAHTSKAGGALDIGKTVFCEKLILEAGFDIYERMALPGDYYSDFMSEYIGDWISPYMWKEMLGQQGDCISPSTKSASQTELSQFLIEKKPTFMNSPTGPTVMITGRVKLDDTGDLDHIFQIDTNGQFDTSPGGEYCLEFQGSGGVILGNYCFDLFTTTCQDCEPTDKDSFVFTLPLADGTEKVVLRHGTKVLDDITKSPNSPSLVVNTPPDDPTVLQWTASDVDGEELHYIVLYSNDGGAFWNPLAIDVSGTSLDIDSLHLGGGENSKFRVLVSDGFNTALDETAAFNVTRKPPLAFISIPAHEAFINYENDDIILLGRGLDCEDGVLNGFNLAWNSDIDGIIGYGSELYLPAKRLSLGSHIITLIAVDSDGMAGSSSVMINAQDKNPPNVTIITPQVNTTLQDGVIFQAQASDLSGIDKLYFYVREPDGDTGVPIGYEGLEASYNSTNAYWEYAFDTTVLQDGYYVILAKAIDNVGNEGWSQVTSFSIRNWAVIELLPSTPDSKAGRTMPVKFSLRIAESVNPTMPFVYNEDLEIRVFRCNNISCSSKTLMQTSTYGTSSTDYRIDTTGQLYITNFKTEKTPATYVVEIWRPRKNFMVGSFAFKTVK